MHRNASETPIVLGISPFTTPYQLWQQKLGLAANEFNRAMLHGTELEPAARAAYERLTGLAMQPLVMVDGEYSASLDGIFDGSEGIFPVAPEPTSWPRICSAWDSFLRYVTEAQAPPLTERDTRIRDDPEWLEAAAKYIALRTAYAELSAKCDEARSRLARLASRAKEPIVIVRCWRMGVALGGTGAATGACPSGRSSPA